jgi:hypothetical protein
MIDLRISYKTENFEQAFGHQFFDRQAASWSQDFTCKQLFGGSLQLWKKWGL